MVEITQYNFSLAELTEALIKQQDLHEGEWIIAVEFNINVGMMGITPEGARPGAMVLANQFQLVERFLGKIPLTWSSMPQRLIRQKRQRSP